MTEELAKMIALSAHGDQKYGDKPYSAHLEAVVGVIKEIGYAENTELLCAAWLHDVLEDTDWDAHALITNGVTPYVLALVDAVTNQPGKNRAERHRLTYPRIARIPDAVTLKLADRIANVRESLANNPAMFALYKREYRNFYMEMPYNYKHAAAWCILGTLIYHEERAILPATLLNPGK